MEKKNLLVLVFCILFLTSLVFNGALIFLLVKNQQTYQQHQVNQKVLDFRNMFTEKILLSGKDIDFDTRLSLETAVRDVGDEEILSQWERFTNSKTREEATAEAKYLLEILIKKTSY